MGTTARRIGQAGVTLVEMLVVMAIIGVLSAVLVPLAIRGGWGSSSEAAFAARDVFTLLKAARVYASTHNVETALVYGGRIVRDSEMALDSSTFPDPCVAVVDSVILARRLTREEMILINEQPSPNPFRLDRTYYFTPVNTSDSTFRTMPKQTALLTDVFQVDDSGIEPVSTTGLTGVMLYDPSDEMFLEPNRDRCTDPLASPLPILDYALDGLPRVDDVAGTFSFPAHRFLPDGTLRVRDGFAPQRIRFRVGAMPDRDYDDRFGSSSNSAEQLVPQTIRVMFDTINPEDSVRYIADNDSPSNTTDDYYAERDVTIELFVPTGRVKMLP